MNQNTNGNQEFRCKYCDNVIHPENMFCPFCGAPITSMDYKNHPGISKQKEALEDELPVINTDEIFRDLEFSAYHNVKVEPKEDELPVIDMEGIFEDVPFADTSSYRPLVSQYYNMETNEEINHLGDGQVSFQKEEPVKKESVKEELDKTQEVVIHPPGLEEKPQKVEESKETPVRREPSTVPEQVESEVDEDEDEDEEYEEPPKKKGKKKWLLVSGGLIVAALVWFFGFYNKVVRANLLDLCTVKYTGINGNGNIELTFNERCDLYDDFAIAENKEACDELKKIQFVASPNTGLKNGDKVTIRADYSKADLAKFHVKVKSATKEVVVDGLKDAAEYDLFSGITVSFEGFDGVGKATIDSSRCDGFVKANVTYSFEGESENLKNTDTVVVLAQVEDSVLEENHYTVKSKRKNFSVEGLLSVRDYDVFKNVSIQYSGASPRLTLAVDTSSCVTFVKEHVEFLLSETENIASGDSITITAKFDEKEAQEAGYKIKNKEKKFKVGNVSSYLSKVTPSQNQTLKNVLSEYLSKNKQANGNGYLFDKELDDLVGDGEGYTTKDIQEEVAGTYFLYDSEKNVINSYLLVMKYTVTVQSQQTDETKQIVLYAEASVNNIYIGNDQTVLRYESPSEIVTDTDYDYFVSQINESQYKVIKDV